MKSLPKGILLTAFIVLAVTIPVFASDNVTGIHWHTKSLTYNLNSSLPSTWIGATAEAAKAWTDRTALKFNRGANTTSTDPTTSQHIVWNGSIPSIWQSGCPPSTTLACTYTQWDGSNHITDTDLVYNSIQYTFGTSSFNCALNIGYDVQTVGLHEFGHWGYLTHSSDTSAAMYASYNGCQRTPAQHDIDSMNANYVGH